MRKIRIIADEKIPFLKGALDGLTDIRYLPGSEIDREAVRNADALLIRTRTHCNRELLEGTDVKFIATATIGYDHIDTRWCDQNGIRWTNAPGCNSDSVNQYLRGALFYLTEKHGLNPGSMTLGVIGAGNVGSKVALSAGLMGFRVLVNDPPRQDAEGPEGFTGLDTLLKESDILSLHVPLTQGGKYPTFGMVDAGFFEKLKENAIFINTSRGEVVREADLRASLERNKLRSAVLDVWDHEPGIDAELLNLCELGTAHIAGYSTDGKANGTRMSVRALSSFFGLGLDAWEPGNLPVPETSHLTLDCQGLSEPEILGAAHRFSYDIRDDDLLLRKDPESFEYLRGSYRIRREEKAYSLKLINNPWSGLTEKLDGMGFSVLETDCFC